MTDEEPIRKKSTLRSHDDDVAHSTLRGRKSKKRTVAEAAKAAKPKAAKPKATKLKAAKPKVARYKVSTFPWQTPPILSSDWRIEGMKYRMSSKLSAGMPDEMKEALREASRRLGKSMTELVRNMIARSL